MTHSFGTAKKSQCCVCGDFAASWQRSTVITGGIFAKYFQKKLCAPLRSLLGSAPSPATPGDVDP